MQQTISAPAPAAAPAIDSRARRQVAAWLLLCCALVFAMVVVGGVTRLTRSGLSIVEWQPLMGAIPPLSESHWQELFAKYQRTPEYLQVNQGMPLDEFKRIFWWEYMHRLLGRVIGLAFFVPLVWFLVKGRIARALAPRLVVIFLLGGLQGAVGWWMVKSGLIDDPRVSHVRLSIHLGIAFIIFAAMFWTALGLLSGEAARDPLRRRLAGYGAGLSALIFVMVLSGGLVAGTRAGYAYNTFPLMNGHVLPPEYFMLEPWWENLLHNMATVQFNHRLIAWLLLFSIPAFWWALRRFRFALPSRARVASSLLLAMLGLQLALGIGTLLLRVPVTLGTAHQAGAMLLFALALWTTHTLYREPLRTGQT